MDENFTQRDEVLHFIDETYGIQPEYPWEKTPDSAVFRHENNRKWFALIMTISTDKLGYKDNRLADVLNVKCDPIMSGSLRQQEGIFPAYHMNKEKWISVILDGRVSLEDIFCCIEMSYELTM